MEKAEVFTNKETSSARSCAFRSGRFSGRESTQQLQETLLMKVTCSLWNICCYKVSWLFALPECLCNKYLQLSDISKGFLQRREAIFYYLSVQNHYYLWFSIQIRDIFFYFTWLCYQSNEILVIKNWKCLVISIGFNLSMIYLTYLCLQSFLFGHLLDFTDFLNYAVKKKNLLLCS